MPRKAPRDYTMAEQLARGPLDLPFLMLTMMLLGIGLVMMFSASYAVAYYDPQVSSPYFYIKRQASFAVGGVIIMMIVSHINYQSFRWMSVPAIVGSIFLLVLVYTPLGVEENQARRWLKLGIRFQPSEIAKVAVILFFAAMLCKRDTRKPRHWKNRTAFGRTMNFLERIGFVELLPYGAILGVIALLVVKQPHLSGTLLILAGGASVLFAAGIHWGWFVAGISFVSAAVWFVITNTAYMTDRINLWLDPWADFRGNGWQTCQSLLAMGSGGLFGVGLGNSKGKFDYVSESENDFVFSILVEELGYIGGAIVLILFALLILRGYWLALHARDKFGTLTAVGIITLLAVQVFLNVGVVTNLIPNTGISLPFFSFGGTALVIQLAEMGMVLSISRQIPPVKQDR